MGSEMCIRDRVTTGKPPSAARRRELCALSAEARSITSRIQTMDLAESTAAAPSPAPPSAVVTRSRQTARSRAWAELRDRRRAAVAAVPRHAWIQAMVQFRLRAWLRRARARRSAARELVRRKPHPSYRVDERTGAFAFYDVGYDVATGKFKYLSLIHI